MGGGHVRVRSVDTSFVRYKINLSPKNVYGIVKPFGLDNGIKPLKMAPTCLLVLHMVDIVANVEADYVTVSKHVFEGHDYEY